MFTDFGLTLCEYKVEDETLSSPMEEVQKPTIDH
jgi:hypothetical protein